MADHRTELERLLDRHIARERVIEDRETLGSRAHETPSQRLSELLQMREGLEQERDADE